MRIVSISACYRVTSHVDLKTADDALYIQTCHWPQYAREIYKEVSEVRKLITLEQFVEDIKAEGLETDQVFVDPDEVVQIPEIEHED